MSDEIEEQTVPGTVVLYVVVWIWIL